MLRIIIVVSLLVISSYCSPVPEIIGGVEAQQGEFPFLVSIQAYTDGGFSHICGGTIVNRNHVVTGAHCVALWSEHEIRIVAGVHNIMSSENRQQIVQTLRITRHMQYDQWLFRNDIAVLEIFPAFVETDRVKFLQMPPNSISSTGTCTVAGWGWTTESGPGSDVLRKVEMPIVHKDACRQIYPNDFHSETQMCAGRWEGGADACTGDTGGPLICEDLGYKYFAGIASYGYMCARPGYPGVYTEVSKFIEWIQVATASVAEFETKPVPVSKV